MVLVDLYFGCSLALVLIMVFANVGYFLLKYLPRIHLLSAFACLERRFKACLGAGKAQPPSLSLFLLKGRGNLIHCLTALLVQTPQESTDPSFPRHEPKDGGSTQVKTQQVLNC